MVQDCPKELEWIRRVGDGAGRVPLHTENIYEQLGVPADKILHSGNFRRAMHGDELDNFRIPANEIEEFDVKLGHGGQGTVFKGKWPRRRGQDVAIKKWGEAKDIDGLAKYKHEVKVLARLDHR